MLDFILKFSIIRLINYVKYDIINEQPKNGDFEGGEISPKERGIFMYEQEIKRKARERARERVRNNEPDWTLKYETLKDPKTGKEVGKQDMKIYLSILTRAVEEFRKK